MYVIVRQRGPWQTEGRWQERGRDREIVIEIEPRCVAMRLKGTRRRFRMTWEKMYQIAVEATAAAEAPAGPGGAACAAARLAGFSLPCLVPIAVRNRKEQSHGTQGKAEVGAAGSGDAAAGVDAVLRLRR